MFAFIIYCLSLLFTVPSRMRLRMTMRFSPTRRPTWQKVGTRAQNTLLLFILSVNYVHVSTHAHVHCMWVHVSYVGVYARSCLGVWMVFTSAPLFGDIVSEMSTQRWKRPLTATPAGSINMHKCKWRHAFWGDSSRRPKKTNNCAE